MNEYFIMILFRVIIFIDIGMIIFVNSNLILLKIVIIFQFCFMNHYIMILLILIFIDGNSILAWSFLQTGVDLLTWEAPFVFF